MLKYQFPKFDQNKCFLVCLPKKSAFSKIAFDKL